MANFHNQLLKYEQEISLSKTKQENIIDKHNKLRKVIEDYFNRKVGFRIPSFYIQGSYKMNLMIQKKDGTYDVDLGVYFKDKPTQTCAVVQGYVLEAVKNHTNGGASHLKKCIRVNYANDFNIDLPVYYQRDIDSIAKLAVKGYDWRDDDPEKMVNWFNEKRKSKEINNNGQLIRIVKYLKRWANFLGFNTPSGLALTVWAANNFVPSNDRDDISLIRTIESIKNPFWFSIECKCPVAPFDDLLGNLDYNQKDKFKTAITILYEDGAKAIETNDNSLAAKLWQKHLK